jgi:hypothetical protein
MCRSSDADAIAPQRDGVTVQLQFHLCLMQHPSVMSSPAPSFMLLPAAQSTYCATAWSRSVSPHARMMPRLLLPASCRSVHVLRHSLVPQRIPPGPDDAPHVGGAASILVATMGLPASCRSVHVLRHGLVPQSILPGPHDAPHMGGAHHRDHRADVQQRLIPAVALCARADACTEYTGWHLQDTRSTM